MKIKKFITKGTVIYAIVILLCVSIFEMVGSVCANQHSKGNVLATIGQTQITKKDLETRIRNLPPEMKEVFLNDSNEKEQLLRELVRIEVFSREAAQLKLDETERFKRITSEVIKTMLAEEYTSEKIISKIIISEEDAELYYRTHMKEFETAEEIVASFIWVKTHADDTQDKKNAKKITAEEIKAQLEAGEPFAPLTTKLKKELADIQSTENEYIPRGRLVPQVEDIVFKLEIDAVSPVIPIDDGFLVFKVYDKLASRLNTYDDVRDEIFQKLELQERNRIFNDEESRLFKKYDVEIAGGNWIVENENDQNDSGFEDDSLTEVLVGKIVNIEKFESQSSDHDIMGIITVGGMGRSSKIDHMVVEILQETKFYRKFNGEYTEQLFNNLKINSLVEILPKGPMTMSYPPTLQARKVVITE